jgi:peptide-methionine (S)-S-oxide reductase
LKKKKGRLISIITTMANHLPPLLARLIRPFTYSARLSLAADGGAGGATTQRCTIASGCFWGTEHLYRKHFTGKGLIDAKVGYTGGDLNDPSYKVVCGGKTGRKPPPPPLPSISPIAN